MPLHFASFRHSATCACQLSEAECQLLYLSLEFKAKADWPLSAFVSGSGRGLTGGDAFASNHSMFLLICSLFLLDIEKQLQ